MRPSPPLQRTKNQESRKKKIIFFSGNKAGEKSERERAESCIIGPQKSHESERGNAKTVPLPPGRPRMQQMAPHHPTTEQNTAGGGR